MFKYVFDFNFLLFFLGFVFIYIFYTSMYFYGSGGEGGSSQCSVRVSRLRCGLDKKTGK